MSEEKEQVDVTGFAGIDLSSFKKIWGNLTTPVRVAVLAVAAIMVIIIGVLVITHLASPPMEVLFSELDPEQAQTIVAELEESGVPYQVGDDAATILVPREEKDRLRLKYSPEINSQGTGFALFQNNSLVTSDFERRIQWQIALEEELCRTISSIEAVEKARVHLVIPEESVFVREKGEPSASIFLKVNPMTALDERQIQGILNLVAGSVENLSPRNITVVDSRGTPLFDPFQQQEEGQPGLSTVEKQLSLTRKFENDMEGQLRSFLERIYGPGRVVVMVSAALDFDKKELTSITYDRPVSLSEQRIEERYEGGGAGPAEVGESNIPGYAAMDGNDDYRYERLEEILNHEISETREYLASAPGEVKRISVAVVLDAAAGNPEVIAQTNTVMQSALGIDPGRGDTFSVQLIPFDDSWKEEFAETPADNELLFGLEPGYLAALAGGVVLLIFLIAAATVIVRKLRREPQSGLLTTEAALTEAMDRQVAEEVDLGKRQRVQQLGRDEPEKVAMLLKTWLAED